MQPNTDTTKQASPTPRKMRWRKPAALAFAGLLGAGVIATGTSSPVPQALADTQSSGQVVMPFGNAPASFADLVEKVQDAVVSIHVTNGAKTVGIPGLGGGSGGIPGLPDDHPLNELFKRFGGGKGGSGPSIPMPRPSLAQGSGFVVSEDGYVVTNNHVVDGAAKIKVSFNEREKYDAELIGKDARTDLALLKIKSDKSFHHVRFAPKRARVGDWVVAVGNPFGLGGTVTAGIVSAQGRQIGSGPYDYLQIDAAVNRGNSGGPTFNLDGEVVGVNTAIYSPSGGNVGIAFAVPARLAQDVVDELRSSGSVSRGWLGVHIQNISEDIAASLGMDRAMGALVSKVTEDGPAASSDLEVGDAIIEVNGESVESSRDLARKIAALDPDTIASLTVIRDSGEQQVDVKLGTFPGGDKLAKLEQGSRKTATTELKDLGLTLSRQAC